MPTRLEAALWVVVAQRLSREGDAHVAACAALARAVECAPGDIDLLTLQGQFAAGRGGEGFDVCAYVIAPTLLDASEEGSEPVVTAQSK
ncbi:hypothetical protein ACW9HC_34485 [Nocardia gipuzkoensis]